MSTSYVCTYCREEHPRSTRSVEHVIPEALGNTTLKLPDVCKYWNNFFAVSFEAAVTKDEFVQLVVREYGLGSVLRKPTRIQEVKTARGTTEYLWHVNGQEVLRDKPVRKTTNTIEFEWAIDKDDHPHVVTITLPFEYIVGTTGDETESLDAKAKAEQHLRKVLDYLQRLARNPEIDPVLAETLEERGLKLAVPRGIRYDIDVQHVSDGGPVTDILPTAHLIDLELWSKFYLKVAWCFASLKLGTRFVALEDPEILHLLRGGAVDSSLIVLAASEGREHVEQLFREATADGAKVWLWRQSIPDTVAIIPLLPPSLEPFVCMALEQRKLDATRATNRVALQKPGRLDRKETRPPESERVHRLRLEKLEQGDRAALMCSISLFGGVLEALVQLSPFLPLEALAGVDMEEEVRLPAAKY